MGRILRMNKKGEIIWQFINRSDDAKLYILSWSRYLDKKESFKRISKIYQ